MVCIWAALARSKELSIYFYLRDLHDRHPYLGHSVQELKYILLAYILQTISNVFGQSNFRCQINETTTVAIRNKKS